VGRYVNPVNGARLMHSQKPRVSSVLIAVAVQWWCTCRYKNFRCIVLARIAQTIGDVKSYSHVRTLVMAAAWTRCHC